MQLIALDEKLDKFTLSTFSFSIQTFYILLFFFRASLLSDVVFVALM